MTIALMPTDEDARRRIGADIDETLLVEAAAGTGKTTELVNRILYVIREGRADIHEIVAVTFTEKAAGELKLRLRLGLEQERGRATHPDVARRLDDAVQRLEEAHVSTIHGFCADLLRERPVEARIDPLFRVLTEGQAERLFNEAFEVWFQTHLDNPPEGIRRSLRRPSRGFTPGQLDEDGPMERLRRAGFELTQWRDFRAGWARDPFDRRPAADRIVELVHRLAELSANPSYVNDNLYVDIAPVRRLSSDLRAHGRDVNDLDGLESQLVELRKNRDFRRARKGSGPGYRKGVTRKAVLEARDSLMMALDDFQQRADADVAALVHEELLSCVDHYEALKKREGVLDFLDLLLKARDLVKENAAVRRHFQTRFKRIFVDEFQDTDPLQAELLLLLSARDPEEANWRHVQPRPGKLFIVGDPKQSIYRFRRADVAIYTDVCRQLMDCGAVRVELRKSFRAVPNIQRLVNAAFAPIMDGVRGGVRYMPLEPDRPDYPQQPSVVALPVPRPYAQRYVAAREIERSLPDTVGAYVDWLINKSGWTITERRDPRRRVAIEARHVCILFRRFVSYGDDITRPYVEALEARGIRHLLIGGKAFHDREEIEALRSALMAVEWPDDQLSVFATLRGPLFAINDEDLLEYHHLCGEAARKAPPGGLEKPSNDRGAPRFGALRREGRFHPFRIPPHLPDGLRHVRDALTLLATLHKQRNHVPVADTISRLLQETRAHVGFVLRPGGEQALANVLHVAELARQYELDGGMSFRGFVDVLQQAASSGQAAEAPILEEGADGVRLMTVHKAKGLEFPVVILADITARLTPFEAGRHIDPDSGLCAMRIGGWLPKDLTDHRDEELVREREEAERVAYVAATRARDLLVAPAVGDSPYDEGWIAPLNAALYPSEDARRVQAQAVGCPTFTSKDSVLNRPDGDPATRLTVCPGAHSLGTVDQPHTVVWWSPADLSLGAQTPLGLRCEELIVRDVPLAVLQKYRDDYEKWRADRTSAVESSRRPSITLVTATEAAERGISLVDPAASTDPEPVVAVERVHWNGERPGGTRFGTLVHALLSDVPLDGQVALSGVEGSHSLLDRLGEAHGRILGASELEITVARELVAQTLSHPVMRAAARATAAGKCYRETPVTLQLADGTLVEGHVDLAFADGEELVVVDFKTDRELEGTLDRYRRQVQIYAMAVSRAMGLRTRSVLMSV